MSVAVMRFSRRFACAVAGARRFVYAPVCLRVLLPTWMGAVAGPRRRAAASLRPGPARPGSFYVASARTPESRSAQ